MNQYKKNIHFIINPIAGVRSKKNIPELLDTYLNKEKINYSFQYTERAGHGEELAQQAVKNQMDVVVAVGGDGTINEVAKGLVGTTTPLGIIPMGSGNGLARHLGIPLNIIEAIKYINEATELPIDVGYFNGEMFLCTAGVGFDAEIAHEFDVAKGRGLITYAKCVLKKFMGYKEEVYTLSGDDLSMEVKAFSITLANASQYGNGIFISPESDISDGLLELCVLKPIPWWSMPGIWLKLRAKSIDSSPLYQKYSGNAFKITRKTNGYIHLDGEPGEMGDLIEVFVKKGALLVHKKNQ